MSENISCLLHPVMYIDVYHIACR